MLRMLRAGLSSSHLPSRVRAFAVPTIPPDQATTPRQVRNRRIAFSLLLLIGLCGAAILHRFDPTPHPGERHFYPVCLFHKYTGLYCPGCGTTRGLHALLHGRVLTAVRYNAITMLIGVPVVGWAFLRYGINAMFPRVRQPQWGSVRISQAIGVIVILFSVLRNVPYAPFSYLAPPEPAQAEPKVGL